MSLHPVTETGSTTTPLYYGESDAIGVETGATSATDHLGFNEVTDFTVRLDTAIQVEHYANGVHDTLRIARVVIILDWDGTTYTVNDASYAQTTAGVVTRGGGITINRLGAGDLQITLANAVTSGPTMIADLTPIEWDETNQLPLKINVMRHTYTSTTVFNLRRYSGATIATQALADGPIHVLVHT